MRVLAFWKKVLDLFGRSRGIRYGPSLCASEAIDKPGDLVADEFSLVTPVEFELAFNEYDKIGPIMTTPIEERWPAVVPGVDRSKYPSLKAKCDEIRWAVVRWDHHWRCGRIDGEGDVVGRMIAVKYPYLTPRQRIAAQTYASLANSR